MPTGIPTAGKRNRGAASRKYPPDIASARKVWRDNHYAEKGLSFELFYEFSQKPCYYCGIEKFSVSNSFLKDRLQGCKVSNYGVDNGNFYYNGIDKIDHLLKYVIENMVACCRKCNFMKQRLQIKDFLLQVKLIYEHLHLENYSLAELNNLKRH